MKTCISFFIVFLWCAVLSAQTDRSDRPNILIIMTDQQTAEAMSCAGNQDLHTPAMDFLASNGTRFTEAYCAQPLCTPSRSSMFSGVMPSENGFIGNYPEEDGQWPDSLLFMGKIFKDAGYNTGYVGKWHIPLPASNIAQHGFEYIENTWTGDFMDAAIPAYSARFMKENKDHPFLLVASFLNPHDICEWARDDYLKMDFIDNPPPPEECPELPYNWKISPLEPPIIREQQKVNLRTYPSIDWGEGRWRQYRWAYNRLVERVDGYVQMILDGLKKYGLEDNTIIIFTSDHGDGYAAHQWNQKQVLYQESIKVPFIISKIGDFQPEVNDRLICNGTDIMTTACSYAGIEGPSYLKGRDISQIMHGKQSEWRDTLVVETDFADNTVLLDIKGRAVITSQYKYIIYSKGERREQLFDLKSDPGETKNLVYDKRYQTTLADMRNYLKNYSDTEREIFGL